MTDSTVRVIFLGDSASAMRSVRILEGGFSSLSRSALRLAGAVGITLAGALTLSVKSAIDFDRAMRNVNSIARLNETQFKALSKSVLDLAKTTGQSPKILAEGLYNIVSSGFKAADALKILNAAAVAATAGMTTTETAAKAITAILNAYQLSADQASKVSSLLFKEVQLGVNTFEELAMNIGDTAPMAAALKIPFSDVAAALALITLHGTNMAEASTQVSRVMADLMKPSVGLSAQLLKMGFATGQAAIESLGFVGVIQKLSAAAKGSSATTADWFANIRSLRGMLNLTGPNLKKFDQFAREMAKSFREGGDDVKAFNEQSKSIGVQWDKAKAALVAAAIPLGQLLFPALAKAAGGAQRLAAGLTRVLDASGAHNKIRQLGDEIRGLGESIRKGLVGWEERPDPKAMHKAIPGRMLGFGDMEGTVKHLGLGDQIAKGIEATDWAVVGGAIVDGIAKGIKASATLAMSIAGAVSAAVDQINWEQVGVKLGPALASAIAAAFLTITDPGFWVRHWKMALAIGLFAFGGLIGKAFKGIGGLMFRALEGPLTDALYAIERTMGPRAAFIALAIMKAFYRLPGQLTALLGKVSEFISKHFGKILAFTIKILGIQAALGAIAQLAKAIVGKLGQALGWLKDELGKVAGWIVSAFTTNPITTATSVVKTLWSWIKKLFEFAGKVISLTIDIALHFPGQSVWNAVRSAGSSIVAKARRAMGGFIPGATGQAVPILAHAGEAILNPAQVEALGGAQALSRMFGWSGDQAAFAKGGVVGGMKMSTGTPHRKRSARRVRAKTAIARKALARVDAFNVAEEDSDRGYGQLARELGISQETYILTDDAGNEILNVNDITQRLSEIDQLITKRTELLSLIDSEKAALKAALEALKKAIAELKKAIAEERKAAERDRKQVAALTRQIQAERKKKKPDQKVIDRLEKQVAGLNTSAGKHDTTAGTYATTLADLRTDTTDANSNLVHSIPFDRRDVTLDIAELREEARQIRAIRARPATDTGGGGGSDTGVAAEGAAATVSSALTGYDIEKLLAQLAQFKQALAIQGVQIPLIGSYQRGTLHVPETGMYELHSGERVTSAGVPGGVAVAQPVQSHEILLDLGEPLNKMVDSRVIELTPTISVLLGDSAERRRREGR